MTDPGLTRRLRQQAHRSGLAIGISMALAIAVCIGGFTWLYVQLDPWVQDFAGREPAPTATPRERASNTDDRDTEEEQPADEEEESDEEEPTREPEPEEDNGEEDENDIQPVEDDDDDDFDANYQVVALEAVRLRSGPGVNFDIVIDGLPTGTPLEFLGDREPSQNPDADGDIEWLHFRVEGGEEGWIRQIDVGET